MTTEVSQYVFNHEKLLTFMDKWEKDPNFISSLTYDQKLHPYNLRHLDYDVNHLLHNPSIFGILTTNQKIKLAILMLDILDDYEEDYKNSVFNCIDAAREIFKSLVPETTIELAFSNTTTTEVIIGVRNLENFYELLELSDTCNIDHIFGFYIEGYDHNDFFRDLEYLIDTDFRDLENHRKYELAFMILDNDNICALNELDCDANFQFTQIAIDLFKSIIPDEAYVIK